MEKASKKLILFTFLVIALMVIEGGAIAKVEASRVLPAEAEAVAEAEAEALITTLESTLTNTGGAVAKMEASRVLVAEALIKALDIVPRCPFPCSTDMQCLIRTCSRTKCAAIGETTLRRCVFDM